MQIHSPIRERLFSTGLFVRRLRSIPAKPPPSLTHHPAAQAAYLPYLERRGYRWPVSSSQSHSHVVSPPSATTAGSSRRRSTAARPHHPPRRLPLLQSQPASLARSC